jgi:hypothetical protein
MKSKTLLLIFVLSGLVYFSYGQSKPAHPAHFHEYLGKNASWIDREVRARYDLKLDKEKISKDSLRLVVYNALSDIEVTFYLVEDACEYISFDDYSLDSNRVKSFFTQWCSDVTDHYKFIAEDDDMYPMFMDPVHDVVFFIPEDQHLESGLRYFLFSGFIRDTQLFSSR